MNRSDAKSRFVAVAGVFLIGGGVSALNLGLGVGLIGLIVGLAAAWGLARWAGRSLAELVLVVYVIFFALSLSDIGRIQFRGQETPIYVALLPVALISLISEKGTAAAGGADRQRVNRVRSVSLIGFLLTLMASIFVSGDRPTSIVTTTFMAISLAGYWMLAQVTQRPLWLKLVAATLAAMFWPLLAGLYRLFFDPTSNYRLSFARNVDLPNLTAFFLFPALFIFFGVAFTGALTWKRAAALGLTGVIAYSLVMTGSRGGWLAAAIGLAAVILLLGRRLQWRCLLLVGALTLLIAPLVVPKAILLRAQSFFQPLATTLTDAGEIIPVEETDVGRNSIWRDYWQEVVKAPLTGIGVGYYINTIEGYRSAHNSYLSAWAGAGVFCLLFLLAILTHHALLLWRARAQAGSDLGWFILVGVFVATLTHLVFENFVFTHFFWVFFGLQAAGVNIFLASNAPAQAQART